MRKSFFAICAVLSGSLAVHAVELPCDQIKDSPGVYMVYGDGKIKKLDRINRLPFDKSAKFYVVPNVWRDDGEGVWNVRVSTSAINSRQNDNENVRLLRNAVSSQCRQTNNEYKRDTDLDVTATFKEHDQYIAGERSLPNLRNWHFDAGHPKCYNTADWVKPIEKLDRKLYQSEVAYQHQFVKTSVGNPSPQQRPTYRTLRVADLTSALVFRTSKANACFSFSVPDTGGFLFFSRGWEPKSSGLIISRLPNHKTSRLFIYWNRMSE